MHPGMESRNATKGDTKEMKIAKIAVVVIVIIEAFCEDRDPR